VRQGQGCPDRLDASTQPVLRDLDSVLDNNADCLQAYAGTLLGNPDATYCLYSNIGSSETILLLGDSHARSAFPAIAEYNARHGRNTLMFGVVPKDWQARKDSSYSEALLHAISDQKIHKVFLISRNVMYIKGWDFDAQIGSPRPDWLETSVQPVIDSLRKLGKEVFVVAENPVLPFDPRKLLDVQPFRQTLRGLLGSTNDPFHHGRTDVLEHQKEYLAALDRLRGATVIHSIDAFCPAEECLLFDEQGGLLYRDDDHLSTYAGGRFLVEKLLKPYLDMPSI
jgi:hypothetical protein